MESSRNATRLAEQILSRAGILVQGVHVLLDPCTDHFIFLQGLPLKFQTAVLNFRRVNDVACTTQAEAHLPALRAKDFGKEEPEDEYPTSSK